MNGSNGSQKDEIIKFLDRGMRFDGRKADEFRPIEIEYDISKNAEGSARVKVGSTEILAGVKMEVMAPYPDQPNQGTMMVGAELLPFSNPEFEAGPPSIQAIELARVVDRGIRESKAIDMAGLCIAEGEKCWVVVLDIMTINDEGNLIDASGIGAYAALTRTVFPKYEDGKIDYKAKTGKRLELSRVPVPVTVIKIGRHLIIDPTTEEEKAMDSRLTVTTDEKGIIVALQKGGDQPLSQEEILTMVDLATAKAKEIRKLFA
ncbi:exosome complex protein Rrp42 [Candidatus Woesearchaeota archaeon]|nr:exosome complex protein Rrp42 [Candidatus Woesearchaeota archaeon]